MGDEKAKVGRVVRIVRGQETAAGHLAVLGDGDTLQARTSGGPTRFLIMAARPIREPVARHGPFVMNTREEIHQAVRDFQEGRLG